MNIQWFPGHMNKARKELAERLRQVDLVVEVLDARIPFSSANPMLTELRGDKPYLKVFNKADLGDPSLTTEWEQHFASVGASKALWLSANDPASAETVANACRALLPGKADSVRGIQTLIAGIPNVGKSTLINRLAGRSVTKTGNEPAVTKRQQRIDLRNGIVLFDTPGVLWPNVENRNSGLRLAVTGAIRDTAVEYEDIALFLIEELCARYPEIIRIRFNVDEREGDALTVMDRIGVARGCLIRGGTVDRARVGKIVINEFRTGILGQLTLESPKDRHRELLELDARRAEKAEKKAARAARRKQ